MSSDGSPVSERRGAGDASGLRFAVLVARFNQDITARLLAGAMAAFTEHGATDEAVEVVWVPGAWELPQAAAIAVGTGRFDAVVTLGCVIRGETPHFDYVCSHATLGLGEVARSASVPVVFGVLTTDDRDQAIARAGDGPANKGFETAMAAIDLVAAFKELAGR